MVENTDSDDAASKHTLVPNQTELETLQEDLVPETDRDVKTDVPYDTSTTVSDKSAVEVDIHERNNIQQKKEEKKIKNDSERKAKQRTKDNVPSGEETSEHEKEIKTPTSMTDVEGEMSAARKETEISPTGNEFKIDDMVAQIKDEVNTTPKSSDRESFKQSEGQLKAPLEDTLTKKESAEHLDHADEKAQTKVVVPQTNNRLDKHDIKTSSFPLH